MVKNSLQDDSSSLPKGKISGKTKNQSSDLQNSIDQEQVATDQNFIDSQETMEDIKPEEEGSFFDRIFAWANDQFDQ